MDIPIIFNSSLPRSGSTLLQNLLSQSRRLHCTSTNDMLDLMVRIRDSWMGQTGFIAQGLDKVEPRVRGFLRHAVCGFYEAEFAAGKTVVDKSRGWLSQLEMIEIILGRPVKVLVCVRDLRDVCASFEKIFRRSAFTDHPVAGEDSFRRLTVTGRTERLLDIKYTIGYMVNCVRDAVDRGLADRLVVVPYWELTHFPQQTVRRVCYECGLAPFDCDPSNVPQTTREDDSVYGMRLHDTRPAVEPDPGRSWVGVLPDALVAWVDESFGFVQQLAQQRYLNDWAGVRPALAEVA